MATYHSFSINYIKNLVEDARIEVEKFYDLNLISVESPVYYPLYALANVIDDFAVRIYELPEDYKRRVIRLRKRALKDPFSQVEVHIVRSLENLESRLEFIINHKSSRTSIVLIDAFLPLSHKIDIYEKAIEYDLLYLPALKPGDVEEQIEKLKEHGIYECFLDMAVFGPDTVDRIRRYETITYVYDSIINTKIHAVLYKESLRSLWETFLAVKEIKDRIRHATAKEVREGIITLVSEPSKGLFEELIKNKPTYDITKKVFISIILGSPMVIKRKNQTHRLSGAEFVTASF